MPMLARCGVWRRTFSSTIKAKTSKTSTNAIEVTSWSMNMAVSVMFLAGYQLMKLHASWGFWIFARTSPLKWWRMASRRSVGADRGSPGVPPMYTAS
mmetsp:Transcript_115584/g.181847  ORF Transcript_115584/g.181847 Transcript_115584/m.181847 type:complete len:97 (-) Transcript_115584:91-381(-)